MTKNVDKKSPFRWFFIFFRSRFLLHDYIFPLSLAAYLKGKKLFLNNGAAFI